MTKIVTVHGTGAGDLSDSGSSWWQTGSDFQTELRRRLDLDADNIAIIPFHWKLGPNSENGRRTGGEDLYTLLRGYDAIGEDYYLIGHSHGGSVIHHALLNSMAKKAPLERLKAWCTVGTPFLEYRPNRFLFSRLGNTGLTLYATALGALLIALGLALMYVLGATPFWKSVNTILGRHALMGFYLPVISALLLYGVGVLAFLYATSHVRGGSYTLDTKQKVFTQYGDRWLGLWHEDDEAISALSNVQAVSGPIVPSNFLVPLVAVLPVLATVLACLYAFLYFLLDGRPASPGTTSFFQSVASTFEASPGKPAVGSPLSAMKAIGTPALLGLVIVAVYIGVTALLVTLLQFAARLVGIPLSRMIDGLVWSSVRQQAWGDDRGHEGVHQIGSHPPEFPERFRALPAPIADKLSANSEKHAVLTLHKVRDILGMSRKGPGLSADMRSELSKNLTWRELIHTTYFDIPEFVDLTAYGLNQAGLSTLKSNYWSDPSRNAAAGWRNEIAATA